MADVNIISLKLSTGDEIVCMLANDFNPADQFINVQRARRVEMGLLHVGSMTLTRWFGSNSDDQPFRILVSQIVAMSPPNLDAVREYRKVIEGKRNAPA